MVCLSEPTNFTNTWKPISSPVSAIYYFETNWNYTGCGRDYGFLTKYSFFFLKFMESQYFTVYIYLAKYYTFQLSLHLVIVMWCGLALADEIAVGQVPHQVI